MVTEAGGMRFNKNKPKLSLVPHSLKQHCALALEYGTQKYAKGNWRKGLSWSDTLDSLERHLDAFKEGEDLDPESGLHHLAHMAANVAFLCEFINTRKEFDDREKVRCSDIPINLNLFSSVQEYRQRKEHGTIKEE